MVILWCKIGTVQPLPLRNQEAGFRAPVSQGTGIAGRTGGWQLGVSTQEPKPSLPASHQLSHSLVSSKSDVLHSETGRMFWLWESPTRPEERRERLWRSLFRISLQLLRY